MSSYSRGQTALLFAHNLSIKAVGRKALPTRLRSKANFGILERLLTELLKEDITITDTPPFFRR